MRLFPFGIGYDVNTDLLDTLGSLLGGRSSYVQPDERIDEAVGSFYAQISTPVLANIALDFGERAGVKEMFPYPLPDLFAGEQLVAVGRYEEGGAVDVELKGDVNGTERLYVYPDRELVSSGGEPFVAKLWATRRIGELLSQVRRSGAGAGTDRRDRRPEPALRHCHAIYVVSRAGAGRLRAAAGDGSGWQRRRQRTVGRTARRYAGCSEGGGGGGCRGGRSGAQRGSGRAGQRRPQQLGECHDGDRRTRPCAMPADGPSSAR